MELKQTRQGDSDQHSQRIDGMVQKLEESLEAIKSKGVSGS